MDASTDVGNEQRANNVQYSSAIRFEDLHNYNSQEEPVTSSSLVLFSNFDIESVRGKFEWDLRLNGKLPCITRLVNNVERVQYFSVYHAERFLLAKYLAFISDTVISTCMTVHGYKMTGPEATLLTEINKNHCDPEENYEFKAGQDCIVIAKDLYEFLEFLKTCYDKINIPFFCERPCGFVCFNTMFVPYVDKDGTKYLPTTFFEETPGSNCVQGVQHLMGLTIRLSTLELAYIKFCCMAQGIKTDFISQLQLSTVISLEELVPHFNINTNVYLYWPTKKKLSTQVLNTSQDIGRWIHESSWSSPSITLIELYDGGTVSQDNVTENDGEPTTTTMHVNSDTTSLVGRPENTRRR